LTAFNAMARKPSNSKKRGPHEAIKPQLLFDRYRHLKQFFENEWGRIGLDLRRVRGPKGVRKALMRVPAIEWRMPFREHRAACLIADKSERVKPEELYQTRRQHKEAEDAETRLWSEYHASDQEARKARETVTDFISYYGSSVTLFPFFVVALGLAQKMDVEKLTVKFNQIDKAVKTAQKRKEELKERLNLQEAWFAQNELVKFARNRRVEKTALNYARATAGLPEYSWLHSLRKCRALHNESLDPTGLNFQLFELLRRIVQSMRSVNVRKTELRFQKELLKDGCNPMLTAFLSPNWAYMQQAFAQCRGKGIKRRDLPYKIMGRFFANVERVKTPAEAEVAKKNQLLSH
jgi:hypothetical protein